MANNQNKTYVVLRDERNPTDTRHLSAEIKQNGDLVFTGQDYGSGVEGIFGCTEYEWFWTIKAENVSKFQDAIGEKEHILTLLETKFSHEQAASLQNFMTKNNIPFEFWSRMGD